MKRFISKLIPISVLGKIMQQIAKKNYRKWLDAGSPVPPPHAVKKITIKSYQQKYHHDILIETGTFKGDMIISQINYFEEIYSIELADYYYRKALKRFRNCPKVHLYKGDSSKMLAEIMKKINRPAIFWLDGHYSGGLTAKGESECPIWGELKAILPTSMPHIIVIDDANCFDGVKDYPSIEAIREFVYENADVDYFETKEDMIHIILK
ncbi:MAG: hypothetical protein LBF05_06440 [Tannerella sp.]|jgi:hypothetical protein|nr:hypothetical protein [Tannerella sp.]